MDYSLADKTALVTGGSRGIGRAAALELAKAGADVAIASRKIDDLEEVAAEIKRLGRRAFAVSGHIGRMEDIKELVDKVTNEFGRIDILVNNAGNSPAVAGILEVEERLWDNIMRLNLKGLFFISQAVARVMSEHGGGRIVNIASMSGIRPEKGASIYSISKAGVVMLTKSMALELAQYNIRVNAIAPGMIMTRMAQARFDSFGDKDIVLAKTPLGRIGEPGDVAHAILYLVSDISGFMTGDVLILDGGLLLT
ncbi:SDR family NAD(P)-dependent oxidoreductase [Chloroflexota bacterium]